MYFFKALISYDGTVYHGWQIQPDQPTIVGTLEKTFQKTFHSAVQIIGASRTDAGVHAYGQVARIGISFALSAEELLRAWNNALPKDILIKALEPCTDQFHPHAEVLSKTYSYLLAHTHVSPRNARFVTVYPYPFDEKIFTDCLQTVIGTHDFRSFCTGDEKENTVRTIDSITVSRENSFLKITFVGKGFLRYMIRRIVGGALTIATDIHGSAEQMHAILAEKSPHQQLLTAGPEGLTLESITYLQHHE